METPLRVWRRRCSTGWIAGAEMVELCDAFVAFQDDRARHPGPVRVQLCDTNPARYLAGFFAAMGDEDPVDAFLAPSHGARAELEAFEAAIEPDLFWTGGELVSCGRSRTDRQVRPVARVMIPTGGTTVGLRFAVHTWRTLESAALGLQVWLGGGPIDSLCLLPLHHVSGLMQAVRSYVTGGMLTLSDWSQVAGGDLPSHGVRPGVTSLVPTQLARLLELPDGPEWLRGFRCIFLGGAPAWPELLAHARREKLPLAPCYGMTESAAQVATLRPEEFLAGTSGVGTSLPHATIEVVDEITGAPQPAGVEGRISLRAQSLFCGYHPLPDDRPMDRLVTSDRGVLDAAGHLSVRGRVDALINSGGEKVDPLEVEAAMRGLRCADDVVVFGVPDREWGEVVVAVVADCSMDDETMRAQLKSLLAAHKVPKRFIRTTALPRNQVGKIDRNALREMASNQGIHE